MASPVFPLPPACFHALPDMLQILLLVRSISEAIVPDPIVGARRVATTALVVEAHGSLA